MGQDWSGLIGLRMVAENPDCFARVVAANTGLPMPTGVAPETVQAVKEFRSLETPTPTMAEMAQALQGGEVPREQRFAYWQKWTWETEDPPVGLLIAGSVDGRPFSAAEAAAYDAPFPDPSYKMGPRAMPSQVPTLPDDPALERQQAAWKIFREWTKPFLCAFTDNDPVTGGADRILKARIPGTEGQPHVTIEGGGHFLQEGRGEQLAQTIVDFVDSTPV
jgi:haloalkane dehalogenase